MPKAMNGTGDGKSRGQRLFEKLLLYAFLIVIGYGLATSVNHLDQLQADAEWKAMLLNGEYPGVHLDVGDEHKDLRGSVLPPSRN